jgi:lipid-binding SYLF domain-containing protein
MNSTAVSADRSHGNIVRKVLALSLIVGLTGCANSSKEGSASSANSPESTAKMVEFGSDKMEQFLSHGDTEALKNMLGGARGVFIAPFMSGEAAFLGMDNGNGYLMRRHGKEWSDPVFFKLTEYSLGYQAGAKESHMLVILMTDEAVDQFVKGKMVIGGKGGFAIGTMGLGASGAGGLKGGLELIIVSTNEGVFLGGGMSTITPVPEKKRNDEIYGSNANPTAILAGNGGKYVPAEKVRAKLSQMVVEAWGIPTN